ncbi:MAG: hypothetical protein MJ211_04360 [Bacteroidales bacterium]|nr:hypothetical protein [Bacteroidales bacterium]
MKFNSIAEKSELFFRKKSKTTKSILTILLCLIILGLLFLGGLAIYQHYNYKATVAKYERELQISKQNYFVSTVENSNLEKKLQEMSLRLAETINSMVTLDQMLNQMSDEKANLEEIKNQMEIGIKNTQGQLNKMQNSVNTLIDRQSKVIIRSEYNLLEEKGENR